MSDSNETMAFPRAALSVDDSVIGRVRALCEDEGVELIVIGRPTSLAGASTASTKLADEFFELVELGVDVAVLQVDERLTTVSASRLLRHAGVSERDQRARVDSASAVVLLESVLEARRAL